jgi:hypothetical protein
MCSVFVKGKMSWFLSILLNRHMFCLQRRAIHLLFLSGGIILTLSRLPCPYKGRREKLTNQASSTTTGSCWYSYPVGNLAIGVCKRQVIINVLLSTVFFLAPLWESLDSVPPLSEHRERRYEYLSYLCVVR